MSDPNTNISPTPGSPPPQPSTPAPAPTAVTATPAAPASRSPHPPHPAAPNPAAKPTAKGGDRRFFLLTLVGSWFAVGMTTMTASLVALTAYCGRFMSPNVLNEPPSKFKVGPKDL